MALYLGTNEVCPTKISNNTYGWLGPDVEYVGKLYEWSGTMNDTTYSSWTPSTTSTTVLAAVSNVESITFDKTEYTYYMVGGWDNNFVYNTGTTLTIAAKHFVSAYVYNTYVYPSSYSSYTQNIFDNFTTTSLHGSYYLEYYNSSGALAGASATYGPAYTSTGVTTTISSSGNNITIKFSRPALSARCSTTYFSTDVAANLNLTSSTLKYRLDIFRQPAEYTSVSTKVYHMLADKLNNNFGF